MVFQILFYAPRCLPNLHFRHPICNSLIKRQPPRKKQLPPFSCSDCAKRLCMLRAVNSPQRMSTKSTERRYAPEKEKEVVGMCQMIAIATAPLQSVQLQKHNYLVAADLEMMMGGLPRPCRVAVVIRQLYLYLYLISV